MHALTLVRRLELLALCRVAVHLAHEQCPPPLHAGSGGALRVYREEWLLLLALLRTLWRLSYHGPGPAAALVLRLQPFHQQVLALLGPPYGRIL
jgi:hypothetical protein